MKIRSSHAVIAFWVLVAAGIVVAGVLNGYQFEIASAQDTDAFGALMFAASLGLFIALLVGTVFLAWKDVELFDTRRRRRVPRATARDRERGSARLVVIAGWSFLLAAMVFIAGLVAR